MKIRIHLFIFLALMVISGVSPLHSFSLKETTGGITTGLGGVILDKDLNGLNALYNPSLIAIYSGENNGVMQISGTGAAAPYGISGINNAALGVVFGHTLSDSLGLGYGVGVQTFLVENGLSEYSISLAAGAFYSGIKNSFLSIDGIAISQNFKMKSLSLAGDLTGISGVQNSSMVIDWDVDLTASFADRKYSLGVMAMDLLESQISLLGTPTVNTVKRAIIVHTKLQIVKNFDFFGAVNLTGTPHFTTTDNFFASSTKLADKYFGLEATFIDVLYVRVGVNEGRLGGGIGIKAENLLINLGVMPIPGVNLYYQFDLTYKIPFFKN